jgi:glycosyltransferase involved in cell wall biosynthesis
VDKAQVRLMPLAVSLDVSAIPPRPAGAGRYVLELTRALSTEIDLSLTVVARRGDAARWQALGPSRLISPVWATRPGRIAYERWMLGRSLERLSRPRIAVHHGPHYTLPRHAAPIASVVTIHDLTFFDHPEWHERAKVPFFRRAIRRAAAEADVMICVSRTTAGRLSDLLDPKGDVVVIPHGVDHARFRPDSDPAADAELAARSGVPPGLNYVLHVGTLEPRKGVADLVAAFDELTPVHSDVELVLAGLPGWGAAEVESAIAGSRAPERVRCLGYVADEVVPALMRRAAVVAYPSRDEGFGLPALEALACGAPLVTSSGTAMSEFAGPAAFTAAPGDRQGLAHALASALDSDEAEQRRRRLAGTERASTFTWHRSARAHVAAYERAAGRRRRRTR